MRNRKSIDAFAVLVCIASAALVALSIWHLPPAGDSQVYSEIGRRLARQALALVPPAGQISLIARDTQAYRQPAMEISVKEFSREISRAGVTVSTHLIQLDPLRPVEVPPGDFYEVIRRGKSNEVIVSFLGPPVLEPEQRAKLSAIKPKIVALCIGNMTEQIDLPDLFKRGFLHAAIINRPAAAKDGKDVSAASPSFEAIYAMVQAGDVAQMVSSRP